MMIVLGMDVMDTILSLFLLPHIGHSSHLFFSLLLFPPLLARLVFLALGRFPISPRQSLSLSMTTVMAVRGMHTCET